MKKLLEKRYYNAGGREGGKSGNGGEQRGDGWKVCKINQ